jgi:hypothetical protein
MYEKKYKEMVIFTAELVEELIAGNEIETRRPALICSMVLASTPENSVSNEYIAIGWQRQFVTFLLRTITRMESSQAVMHSLSSCNYVSPSLLAFHLTYTTDAGWLV